MQIIIAKIWVCGKFASGHEYRVAPIESAENVVHVEGCVGDAWDFEGMASTDALEFSVLAFGRVGVEFYGPALYIYDPECRDASLCIEWHFLSTIRPQS